MYRMIMASGYDVVCGSRYARGGRQLGGPRLKRFLSRMAGLSLHYVTGLPTHDATNNYKMYRKSYLDEVSIESRAGFEIGLELVVKAFVHGYRVGEVPTTWRDRSAGQSRFRLWQWLPHYLRWYIYAFRRFMPRSRRVPPRDPVVAAARHADTIHAKTKGLH
jgi:hypothetical protein